MPKRGKRRNGSRKRASAGKSGMPRPGGMMQTTSLKDNIVVRGHQLLGPLATTANSGGLFGGGIGNIELTLANFGGRPQAFAGLYSRYRYKRFAITYIPIVSTMVSGAVAFGILDDEVDGENNSTVSNFTAITQLRTSMNTQVWQKAEMSWVPVDPRKWYYTDKTNTVGVDRFATQITVAAQGSAPALNANGTLGYLRIDYAIEFEGGLPVTNVLQANADTHVQHLTHQPPSSSQDSVWVFKAPPQVAYHDRQVVK